MTVGEEQAFMLLYDIADLAQARCYVSSRPLLHGRRRGAMQIRRLTVAADSHLLGSEVQHAGQTRSDRIGVKF